MSGFPILDLLLGLVFIFFILSIISSAVVEIIMTKMNYRSKILTRWLMNIFAKDMLQPDGKSVPLGTAIANHCLTTALSSEGRATSFIDAKNFVSALFEKITFHPNNPNAAAARSLDDLLDKIDKAVALDGTSLLSTELRRTIQIFGSEARMLAPERVTRQTGEGTDPNPPNSFQIFREKMEAWFDSSMDRISGRMKKKYTRPLTFWVGLIVVVSLNADAIAISRYLYDHKEQTTEFANRVQEAAKHVSTLDTTAEGRAYIAYEAMKDITPPGLPLGWDEDAKRVETKAAGWGGVIKSHLPGWLATIMAIMLGAPFWFDLINKLSNIRGTGTKPPSVTDEERKKKNG